MKKTKLLTPIITVAGLASVVAPIASLSSCSCSNQGNLMTEYTPTIPALSRNSYQDPAAALKKYFEIIKNDKRVFEQDLIYTLSRGLPQYLSYLSEHCEMGKNYFNATVDSITVNDTNYSVSFNLTLDMRYDYTGTKIDELRWYDMSRLKSNTVTKLQFVLDFDTTTWTHISAARRKMTTFAGATQFGISEIGSTVKVLSEKGKATIIKGSDFVEQEIDYNGETGTPSHFILPDANYWGASSHEYFKRNYEVSQIWTSLPSAQIAVLILKYYMSNEHWDAVATPSVLRFGSYHMQNASLKELFTYQEFSGTPNTTTLYGFNASLDSINNTDNLSKASSEIYTNGTFTLPTTYPDANHIVTQVVEGAFDGSQSSYTNLGLPDCVKTLVIPGGAGDGTGVMTIQPRAFRQNYGLTKVQFLKPTTGTQASCYPQFGTDAFHSLHFVNEIDFSDYLPEAGGLLKNYDPDTGAFRSIHYGSPIPSDLVEGTFWIPHKAQDEQIDDWKAFATLLGLHVRETTADPEPGWVVKPK